MQDTSVIGFLRTYIYIYMYTYISVLQIVNFVLVDALKPICRE